jgi:hypothetical protein
MNIEVKQISNGWLVIVSIINKGSSALYCATFTDVMKELATLDKQINDTATP